MKNEEIKAILCARGGYGTIRIIESINFKSFLKKPKWIIGYSDITILHSIVNTYGIASMHATMPKTIKKSNDPSFDKLLSALKGKKISYIEKHNLNIPGKCKGIITGGNLSILCSLIGTPYEIDTDNRILFIEDLNEYLYKLDRMMMQLQLAGKFDKLKGMIVGGMTTMKNTITPFGLTAYEIIQEHISDFEIPVIFDFPAGHVEKNMPLKLGCHIKMEVSDKKAVVEFQD
jgi:muramoyltetrapeptide carboxypeptidase